MKLKPLSKQLIAVGIIGWLGAGCSESWEWKADRRTETDAERTAVAETEVRILAATPYLA